MLDEEYIIASVFSQIYTKIKSSGIQSVLQ